MTTLSDPTFGLLIEIGANLYTRTALETMLMQANLQQYGPPGPAANKQDLLRRHLLGAKAEAQWGNGAAHRALLDFVLLIVRNAGPNIPAVYRDLDRLYEALLADGYQLAPSSSGPIQLLPTDPSAVPLAAEITALEAELSTRGYTTVLNHYRQAVDALVNHMYESANGALRTTLETSSLVLPKASATRDCHKRRRDGGRSNIWCRIIIFPSAMVANSSRVCGI